MKTVAGVQIEATRKDAMKLFRDSSRVLAKMEHNGIKIDRKRLKKTKDQLNEGIKKKTTALSKHTDVLKPWKRRAGKKFSLGSHPQLASVFYGDLGFTPKVFTNTGKPSTDEKTLMSIDHPFIKDYFRIAKFKKALGTLKGIEREIDEYGFLHPFFNLNIASTYRSSSSEPNFQNQQVRDEEIARMVRENFISRWAKGHLVESDFKTLEVGIATCYHKDKRMMQHLKEGYDYHRNMAARLFMCSPDQVSKMARYGAKNMFVFPEFYGSMYPDCAKNLWDWMVRGELKVGDIPMRDWMVKKGITKLGKCDFESTPKNGTYVKHVQEVEDYFWNKEYPEYTAWKKRWHQSYLNSGEIPMLTGFTARGNFNRRQVINYPIQGSAFHCLCWTMCRVESILRKKGMRTLLIGQIHDCLLADCPADELQDYLNIVHRVVSVELPAAWKWIIVPMESEQEVCPIGGTWFDKKQWTKQNGVWQLAA